MNQILPTYRSPSLKLLFPLLLILLSTCKKDCPPEPTPTEPCPCEGDACIDEMMAYTYFLPGTWWVYEEQTSGERDSVYVYEAFEGENASGFRYFTVRMHSEYDGYNYYHEFSETSSSISITRPECFVQQLTRTKTRPGDFVGSGRFLFVPFILNDFRYAGEEDEFLSLDSIQSGSNGTIEQVYFDVDVCRSEAFEHAGFHLSSNIGVVKKSQFNQNQFWNLVEYNIVQ